MQGGCPAYVVMPHCNRAAKSYPDRRCRKKLRCFAAAVPDTGTGYHPSHDYSRRSRPPVQPSLPPPPRHRRAGRHRGRNPRGGRGAQQHSPRNAAHRHGRAGVRCPASPRRVEAVGGRPHQPAARGSAGRDARRPRALGHSPPSGAPALPGPGGVAAPFARGDAGRSRDRAGARHVARPGGSPTGCSASRPLSSPGWARC